QTALGESSPARCFQVDRGILAAAHPWDCVLSALYESRVNRPALPRTGLGVPYGRLLRVARYPNRVASVGIGDVGERSATSAKLTHGIRATTISNGAGYEFREFAVALPDCGYSAQRGRSHMVSRLDETSWSLACPRCSGCLPFCRCGLHSPGFRCDLAERHIWQTDGLDLPDFWVYGRRVGQCADSACRSHSGNAQIYAGCCNGRGAEPTDAITAGCLSPQRGVRFWLEGRSILRNRGQCRAAVHPGAVQIGKDSKPVTMVRWVASLCRRRHFAKRIVC